MTLASRHLIGWSLTLFLAGFFGECASEEAGAIKFSFAPGEKLTYLQNVTAIREKDLGPKGKQVTEATSTTKMTIVSTETGWDVVAEPKSLSMKRNGEVVNDPISTLLSSAVMTYKLDAKGRIIDVEGYEALLDKISKQVPPQIFEQISSVLNVEALKRKDVAEWNGRIGDYVDAEVNVGDTFVADSSLQLPNGATVNYTVRTNIAAIEACADKNCVRIEQAYDSQADNAAKLTGDVLKKVTKVIASQTPDSELEPNTATISGNVTRLMDPNTMLMYGEESTRTINMTIDAPGEGSVPTKMKETRVYTFQY